MTFKSSVASDYTTVIHIPYTPGMLEHEPRNKQGSLEPMRGLFSYSHGVFIIPSQKTA